jgi:DNA polymerase III epsilon subunit-like protein
MRILVFDTETTGLSKSRIIGPCTLDLWPHIVQFSYIIYDTDVMRIKNISDYIVKMKENVVIPDESIAIHHITNEESKKKGNLIYKVLREFFSLLPSVDMIVGHNISFDIDMVKIEVLRLIYDSNCTRQKKTIYKNYFYNITHFKNIYCTMKQSVELCRIPAVDKKGESYFKYPKLIELYKYLFNSESEPQNLHNSLNDILITLRCFIKIQIDKDILEHKERKYKSIYDRVFESSQNPL